MKVRDIIDSRPKITLEDLSRPERLMLKRAFAKTENRPLHVINGPKARMQIVAERMIDKGLCKLVETQFFAVVLTQDGLALAVELSRQGWPNTEKPTGLQAEGRG